MSVSVFGEDDVPLEEALDKVIKELQQTLNYSHCEVRTMAVGLDADQDFKSAYECHSRLEDYADEMVDLFKELKSVSRQILPKPTPEEKVWMKEQIANRKAKKKAEKEREKIEAQAEKEKRKQEKLGKIEEKKE